jgi:hypothetical protein
MASSVVNFPPLGSSTAVVEGGKISPEAHRALLRLYNGHPLVPISTLKGSANVRVPLAAQNQNVEYTFVKTSDDANVGTLVAQGKDLINGQPQLAMNAAQFTVVKLKSDGVSNWYVSN